MRKEAPQTTQEQIEGGQHLEESMEYLKWFYSLSWAERWDLIATAGNWDQQLETLTERRDEREGHTKG